MTNPLPPFAGTELRERREYVFLVLAGVFLGSMIMLNLIGITRFIHIGPLALAVGVLPYPITFFCTDLISELYGRRRASFVVWVGFGLNLFVLGTLWLGNLIPAVTPDAQPPWQVLELSAPVALPNGRIVSDRIELYSLIYACTAGSVLASLIAYLTAQLCDVWLFHFWKRLTGGRHLWLRNNGSTLVSQLVDSVAVISITFGAPFYRGDMALGTLFTLIAGTYAFKFTVALADTLPFYAAVAWLTGFLEIDPDDPALA